MLKTYLEGVEAADKDLPLLGITNLVLANLPSDLLLEANNWVWWSLEKMFLNLLSSYFPHSFLSYLRKWFLSSTRQLATDPHFIYPTSCLIKNVALRDSTFSPTFLSFNSCHISFSSVPQSDPFILTFSQWVASANIGTPASRCPACLLCLWFSSASFNVSAYSSLQI